LNVSLQVILLVCGCYEVEVQNCKCQVYL